MLSTGWHRCRRNVQGSVLGLVPAQGGAAFPFGLFLVGRPGSQDARGNGMFFVAPNYNTSTYGERTDPALRARE